MRKVWLIFLPEYVVLRLSMIVRTVLYIIAIILFIGWALSFFLWHPGHLIHILAAFAVIFFVLGLTRKNEIN
ncbi:MAG: lmo0937 family membrane protein [Bacteroidota bacterium]